VGEGEKSTTLQGSGWRRQSDVHDNVENSLRGEGAARGTTPYVMMNGAKWEALLRAPKQKKNPRATRGAAERGASDEGRGNRSGGRCWIGRDADMNRSAAREV